MKILEAHTSPPLAGTQPHRPIHQPGRLENLVQTECKSPETGTQGCLRASHRGGGRGKDWGQGWRAHSKACAFTLRWETLEGFEQGGMLSLPLLKILC